MTILFTASVLAVLGVECFFHLPFFKTAEVMLKEVKKSAYIIKSKHISDHWKERALLHYSFKILKSSLILAFLLIVLGLCLVLGAGILDLWLKPKPTTIESMTRHTSWVVMIVSAYFYTYLRNRFFTPVRNTDYKFLDRLLHFLAFNTPWIGKVSFELDQLFLQKNCRTNMYSPVFITGLARAGTTILMRTFFNTGVFRSLTYRDMPFVLMPVVWKILSQPFQKNKAEKDRVHGDGIRVNYDSPEAFEEVFWKTFSSKEYLLNDRLIPHAPNYDTLIKFQQFISQVMFSADQPQQRHYLSKNNNNILRVDAIRKAFPEALIIIPFRDPVQHSISLFHQHKKFSEINEKDSFSLKYMKWLGHHEFGLAHKPFVFENCNSMLTNDYSHTNINYWLKLWINTYNYLLASVPPDAAFVSFEELCLNPEKVIKRLFSKISLSVNGSPIKEHIQAPVPKCNYNINTELLKIATSTYSNLIQRAKLL